MATCPLCATNVITESRPWFRENCPQCRGTGKVATGARKFVKSNPKLLDWCQHDAVSGVELPLCSQPVRVKYEGGSFLEITRTTEGVEIRMSGAVSHGDDSLTVIPVASNSIRVLRVRIPEVGWHDPTEARS